MYDEWFGMSDKDPYALHIMPSSSSSSSSSSSAALMLPPTKPPKRKRVILPEEEYVGALETIIERDFFPDSAKTAQHVRLLEAVEKKDHQRINMIKRRIEEEQRKFGATPSPMVAAARQGENDSNMDDASTSSTSGEKKILRIAENKTLSDFFREFNSEDNDSFSKLHAKDNEERRKKYHWMFDDDSLDDTGQRRKAGMLMWYFANGKQLTQGERDKVNKLLLSDIEEDEENRLGGDKRPAQVDTWKFRVRNQLMFPPDLQSSRDTSSLPSTCTSTTGNQLKQASSGRPASSTGSAIQNSTNLITNSSNANIGVSDSQLICNDLETEGLSTALVQLGPHQGGPQATSTLIVERGKLSLAQDSEAPSKKHLKTMKAANAGSLTVLDRNESRSNYYSHLDDDDLIVHKNTRLRGSFLQDREFRDKALQSKMTPMHRHQMSTPSSTLSRPIEAPHSPSVASSIGDGDFMEKMLRPGHSYRPVSMTPSPVPYSSSLNLSPLPQSGLVASPIVTWGSICATPVILDPSIDDMLGEDLRHKNKGAQQPISDLDINTSLLSDTFEIKGASDRERLLHSMVPSAGALSSGERILESRRGKKLSRREDDKRKSSNCNSKKRALTPAAQALAYKIAASSTPSRFSSAKQPSQWHQSSPFEVRSCHLKTPSMESSLRQFYGKKPSSGPKPKKVESRTPKLPSGNSSEDAKKSQSSTDGLLRIG